MSGPWMYRRMGAHPQDDGCFFRVWAPNAREVSVIGDFNGWRDDRDPLACEGDSGLWSGFVAKARPLDLYKFKIRSRHRGHETEKSDPFAFFSETPPKTASRVWKSVYRWRDESWMNQRARKQNLNRPISIYEVHLGSWKRGEGGRFLTYVELAEELPAYVRRMGYTHVELMPVMEHPFYGSWGYQVTSYFAPSSRYGTPDEFKQLIDSFHREDIGVFLDWVPSHFPNDAFALSYFDGTHLFEHEDLRQGFHPDWNSLIFNYGRHEVRDFLIASALFWLDEYHADGLRVDAVASMLYLDYSRKPGEWIPNEYGGRENLEAIRFLRELNETVYRLHPDVHMIAEESTDWPMVSRPTYVGGLGFGMKWDMGWMHDTLRYFRRDPVHRSYHHDQLTFRMIYAFNENFLLALSHDEVVHGKSSLPGKMPNDDWQKFANLRALFAYMFAQPGKKLMFMGMEFGQWEEWNHESGLKWVSAEYPPHRGLRRLVGDLNRFYREQACLHELDFDPRGFRWVDAGDYANSVFSFLRKGREERGQLLVVLNLTPQVLRDYRVGVPRAGTWSERINTDAADYDGSGVGNGAGVASEATASHGFADSLRLTLPPLAALYFLSPNGGAA